MDISHIISKIRLRSAQLGIFWAFLLIFSWFFDLYHVIVRHMIILSKNRLHQSIPSGRLTPSSNESGYSTDLRFSSVVGVFTLFCPFSWISDIWTWKSRSCDITENFQTPIRNQWTKLYPTPRSNIWSVWRCPLRGHLTWVPTGCTTISYHYSHLRYNMNSWVLGFQSYFQWVPNEDDNWSFAAAQHLNFLQW